MFRIKLKIIMTLSFALSSFAVSSQCASAPVGAANEPAIQMKLNGDTQSAYASANTITSNEEAAIVWDDSNDQLAVCDGNNWMYLGPDLPSCSNGQTLTMSGGNWTCT